MVTEVSHSCQSACSHTWSLFVWRPSVMVSEMLRFFTHSLGRTVFLLSVLTVGKCSLCFTRIWSITYMTGWIVSKTIQGVFFKTFQFSSTAGHLCADTNCTSRRCLAQMLINYNLTSQPQDEKCIQTINVPFMEYQTVSVVSTVLEWSLVRIICSFFFYMHICLYLSEEHYETWKYWLYVNC